MEITRQPELLEIIIFLLLQPKMQQINILIVKLKFGIKSAKLHDKKKFNIFADRLHLTVNYSPSEFNHSHKTKRKTQN